jgi:lipopolysaccharide export system permease protein
MAVLVAVLYAFSDLASSNEITALSAGGIRPRQMLVCPWWAFGAVAAAFMYYFNDRVLPESNHALKNLILDIGRKTPTLELREQVVNEVRPGTGKRALLPDGRPHRSRGQHLGQRVHLRRERSQAPADHVCRAGRDGLQRRAHGPLPDALRRLRARGGATARAASRRLYFESQIVPMRDVGNELERRLGGSDRSDREMSIAMLSDNANQRQAQLDSVRAENRDESVKAVRRALAIPVEGDTAAPVRASPSTGYTDPVVAGIAAGTRSRAARTVALEQSVNRYKVEIHKKLAIAFACLVFTLLGPPLALRFPRGGVGLVMAASSVIFSVYWVGLIAGESLADRRVADPAVTMWLSNVVFLIAGLVLASRMGRSAGNTRGGGRLDDALAKLFGRRRRPDRVAAGAVT